MSFVVGLTGGIGSGKSTVADAFARLGIHQVDADLIAREVVEPGEPALDAIRNHFGSQILTADGRLDRPGLRALVFQSSEERRWLEQLLHPLIRARCIERLQQSESDYSLLVSPLLLETDQHTLVDHILVVDIEEAQQVARTCSRDQNSEQQVKAIMRAQLPRDQRLARADSVIDNNGEPKALARQVEELDRQFRKLASTARNR